MTCRRSLTNLACGVLLFIFLVLSYRGIFAFFSGDDLMNIQFLHGYGQRPFLMLLVHAAVVATPEYRPVGGIVYRVLYGLFGLNPMPFRIACYGLFLVNLSLAAYLLKALTKSLRIALFGTLIFCFHACMADLYFNTGTLYDILCFLFAVAAMGYYVSIRQVGEELSGRATVVFLVLYGLALDAKEMGVTVPPILLAYEAIFHPGWTKVQRRFGPIAIASVMTALFLVVKTKVPSQMSINSLYQPRLSLGFVMQQLDHYYSLLLFGARVTTPGLLVGLGALFLAAVLVKNQWMLFGLVFANIGLLPVAVIPARAGFVWYLPYLGWALFLGAAVIRLIDRLSLKRNGAREGIDFNLVDLAAFACVAAALLLVQWKPSREMGQDSLAEQTKLRTLFDAERHTFPALPKQSRLLIEEDQFGEVSWLPLFLTRLAYHDATIWVDRVPQLGAVYKPDDVSAYAGMITAKAGTVEARLGSVTSEIPLIRITTEPAVVHRGLAMEVRLPTIYQGCRVDVELRLPEDELARSELLQNWCTLDAAGHCQVPVGQDAERGPIQVQRVRLCGGAWVRASGSFDVVP